MSAAANTVTPAAIAAPAFAGASGDGGCRDGLPRKYGNLDQLQADAQPLLTTQVCGYLRSG
jgi:hypothetical protein